MRSSQHKSKHPECAFRTSNINYRAFILILFTVNYASSICVAQRFKAGLTAGLVATDVNGNDPVDHDNDFNKLGYVFGGFVNIPLSSKAVAEFEINIIQKGTLQNPDT